MSLRVLFLSHYYAPELGAPQTRLRETARELRALGHDVRVVTGPPHYPDGVVRPGYSALRPSRERIDGVPVLRLPMIPRGNGGFVDRTIDQASFAGAALAATDEARWADVAVVESPPLFLGLTGAGLRAATGTPYVFHVADPWPDVAIAAGALRNPVAKRVAYAIERAAYARAAAITTPTQALVEMLETKPGARGKVRLVPNAVDTRRFAPDRDPRDARAALGWPADPFTLVYAGTVGIAQGLGTLLDAAAELRDEGVEIHVVGQGVEQAALAREASERGLRHVHFDAALSAAGVPAVLAAADATLTMLRDNPVYEHLLPTKLLEGLAAGRPVVASARGEAARIVDEAMAGVSAAPEDAAALADAIRRLAATPPGARRAMGDAGRRVAAETYDRRIVVGRLAGYLADAAATAGRSSIRRPTRQ